MDVLRRLWQGKFSLPMTFWGFYCAGLIACFVLSGMILFLGRVFGTRSIAFALGLALTYGYLVVATVGVWRSAGPSWASPIWLSRIWAAAARLWVIGWIANVAFNLADGGAAALMQWIMREPGL
jgi:hypothetical protein